MQHITKKRKTLKRQISSIPARQDQRDIARDTTVNAKKKLMQL